MFKKLSSLFSAPQKPADYSYWLHVRCNRCGELIKARVDLRNDLSIDDESPDGGFFTRKVLIGEQRCFQSIEVELRFNSRRQIVDRQIRGGEFND